MHSYGDKFMHTHTLRFTIWNKLLFYILIMAFASFYAFGNTQSMSQAREEGKDENSSEPGIPEKLEDISEWREYVCNIWFYDQDMKKVLPQVNYNWLVVKLTPEDGYRTGQELPDKIQELNTNLKEHIVHYVYDPSVSEDMVAYRTTESNLPHVLEKTRQNSKVDYVHPALQINGKLYATLNKVEIRWKTLIDQERRRKLLKDVYTGDFKYSQQKQTELIEIDFSKIPVWQAANLLAEDIQVIYARPLLLKLEEPITCNLRIDQPGGNIGTPIPFTLGIDFRKRIKLNTGSIVNINIAPGDVSNDLVDINYDKPLSTINVNQSPVHISGEIRIYTPGEFIIPRIPIAYKYRENGKFKVRNIYTEKTTIKIGSIVPAGQGKNSLKTADINTDTPVSGISSPKKSARSYLLLSLVCLVLTTVSASCFLHVLKMDKKPPAEEEPPAQANLYKSLSGWADKNTDEFDIEGIKELYRTVRRYIIHTYAVPGSLNGGSALKFIQNASDYLSFDLQNTLLDIESTLEEIVAKNQIDKAKLEDALRSLQMFLKQEQQHNIQ